MENYISVSQINTYIKNIFEAEVMLQNIYVYGEVSSYKISNGIAYFNIQDENGLLPCVLFNALKFDTPQVGDMVLLRGSISYYTKGGKLSFNAYSIEPYGKGLLYEKFIELKNKLETLGYFDSARKKPLPERVKRIGVVTSSTGAVIQDIIDVTTRRNDTIDIVLYPVKVQGVGADFEIAEGIKYFSEYPNVDVIIVARGGGSMEDLMPFNSKVVADAVFDCKKPLVSAVGHETDYTIIDFVSDLRAPTPSAAAELVAWKKLDFVDDIDNQIDKMVKILQNKIDLKVSSLSNGLNKIKYSISAKVEQYSNMLYKNCIELSNKIDKKVLTYQSNLDIMNSRINGLNPNKLLDKGYVKVYQDGNVVKFAKDIDKDSKISIKYVDGEVLATPNEINLKKKGEINE